MNLLLILALPFLGSVVVAALANEARRTAAWVAGIATVAALAALASLYAEVAAGQVLKVSWPWLPQFGLDFALRLDGFAWMFAFLVLGIGALVVLYAAYYLAAQDPAARFYAFLLAFMGAMLGVVLSGNLILMVLFWELTSLASFLLIGYWRHQAAARQGARMALAVTAAGGLCLFAGVILLGQIVGGYDLDRVLASGEAIRAHPGYLPALTLILLGALTKSAQFPFHFWLPHAMAAPTPVSAYLHSATMVKAGVFLLARLWPALAGSEAWFWIVSLAGLATLLLGAYVAIFQHDLKGLLAYSTISHLGLITLLFGLNSPLAAVAGVFHILNHAAFKASLFMAAGIIDHETGSRDMRKLNGLFRAMPITATLAMVAAAAMAGVPLFNGFLSKEMFFAETLFVEGHRLIEIATPAAATLAGVFAVAYSLRFIHDVFFNGEPIGLAKTPHEPPRWMRLPVELLVLICIVVGLAPALTVGPLLAVAARAVVGGTLPAYNLAIWHGFNAPLLMSAIAIAAGVALYFALQKGVGLKAFLRAPVAGHMDGKRAFDRLLRQATRGASVLTAGLENRSLQRYLVIALVVAIAAAAWPLFQAPLAFGALTPVSPAVATVVAIGIVCTLGVLAYHRERLIALIFMGVVGLVVSLAFVYFSAPDLALTQLLVEVVTIILMMLALHYLPARSPPERSTARKLRDGALALTAGGGVTTLAWWVLTRPGAPSIAPYYLERTVSEGGGANAVNVIIVDFRGFDTFGEITVLALAGLIIHSLLIGFHPRPLPTLPLASDRHPLVLALAARLLLPMATLVSIYFFLRGHNLPGGGFIAGLVLAVAIILQYVTSGAQWVEARWHPRAHAWIGCGLLIAGATGIASWAVQHPFLTSATRYFELPLLGKVPIASAMLFDLGVFLTVVGATLLTLSAIGHLSHVARISHRGAR